MFFPFSPSPPFTYSCSSPSQYLEPHSCASPSKEAKFRGRSRRQIDHHSFRAWPFGRSSIHHAHHDLLPVGEICNANDGSEGIRGMGGQHRALVEGHAARSLFAVESGAIVRGQPLSDLENRRRFLDNCGGWRRSRRAAGHNQQRQERDDTAGDRPAMRGCDMAPFRYHSVEVTQRPRQRAETRNAPCFAVVIRSG